MANAIKDLRSLPLFEIIGAPLIAIIQAQAQAVRATVEFIEQVGFSGDNDSGNARGGFDAADRNVGKLRMVEFHYTKPDENDEPAEFSARVPILSIVPVPGIQVRNARIAFTAKINDVSAEKATSSISPRGMDRRITWLKPSLIQFRGGLAPAAKPEGTSRSRGNYELNIELELAEMPVAPGLEKILNTMDQAISERKKALDQPPQ